MKTRLFVFRFYFSNSLIMMLLLLGLFSCRQPLAKLPEAVEHSTLSVRQNMPDTTSKRILFIGDSMVAGLMYRLQAYCEANGHVQKPVIWYSSTTEWFAKYDTIPYFINAFKPDLVLVTIGANEMFITDILTQRQPYIEDMLQQIGTVPSLWIGPPNWRDDSGINDLIKKNVGQHRFFLSKGLPFKRQSDGAHPTRASSDMWMDSVAYWIMHKSDARLKMNAPNRQLKQAPTELVTVIQPPKEEWDLELKRRFRVDSIRKARKRYNEKQEQKNKTETLLNDTI